LIFERYAHRGHDRTAVLLVPPATITDAIAAERGCGSADGEFREDDDAKTVTRKADAKRIFGTPATESDVATVAAASFKSIDTRKDGAGSSRGDNERSRIPIATNGKWGERFSPTKRSPRNFPRTPRRYFSGDFSRLLRGLFLVLSRKILLDVTVTRTDREILLSAVRRGDLTYEEFLSCPNLRALAWPRMISETEGVPWKCF
jgi:hypothetical protein